jgi:methionyl aminopeptidase
MNKIEAMRKGGKITALALRRVCESAAEGVSLSELDRLAESVIVEAGGTASFKSVPGYRWATCLNVNDGVVHGVPGPYKLKDGDLLSVDLGTLYEGFHTDAARTVLVGSGRDDRQKRKFLRVGETALVRAISQARAGNRVGHVSQAIQETVEEAGYAVVRELVGHAVGRELHERPQIPGFLSRDLEKTPPLEEGATLAVEVIYTQGSPRVEIDRSDDWTVRTLDGSLAGLFEDTVAVGKGETEVLTREV